MEKLLADSPRGHRTDSIRQAIHRINVTMHEFANWLSFNFPRYHKLKYDIRQLSPEQIQQRLPSQTGYLAYYINETNSSLIVFLITCSGSSVYQIALPKEFPGVVQSLWQSIHHSPGMFIFNGRQQAEILHKWLIRPVVGSLKKLNRVIVSRDGILHYIPFDILQDNTDSGSYFGDKVAISYGYSAELTFTPPHYRQKRPLQVTGFAPYVDRMHKTATDSAHILRWSLAEIKAWGGQALHDQSATKMAFLRKAPTSDILILATHAVANITSPEHSYIAFHPIGSDTLLRATEIANLTLDSLQLTVLNACEGNKGFIQASEGPLSLARAFHLAGCRAILTTSWKASDESTAAFNQRFHYYVASGLPTDVALQKTRSDFRTDEHFSKWRHPFHWANFALIGTPATLYPRATLPAEASIILAVFVLLLVHYQLTKPR